VLEPRHDMFAIDCYNFLVFFRHGLLIKS